MESQNFAEQLIAARKASGMTQEQLGEMMHMSRQGISHWENGRALPDAETLKQLSKVLNYNFVTSEFMTEEEQPPVTPAEGAKPARPGVLQWLPVLLLAAGVVLLAALVLVLARQPGGSGGDGSRLSAGTALPAVTQAPAEKADVRIVPYQNPITPSIDPVLGPTPWWIYRLTIQERAGVDFTVEKMTTTYHFTDGTATVVEQGAESIAANWGSNVLRAGFDRSWNGAQPLYDYSHITIRLDGTDAKGNVLSFEEVIYTKKAEPTATPAVDPTMVGCLSVAPVENPVLPVMDEAFGPNPMWIYTFDIFESAGVPLTLEKVTLTSHYGPGDEVQVFDAAMIAEIFGTNVLPGGSALPWTGGNVVCDMSGVTMQVDAIDQNGNALSATADVTLQQPEAE